MDRIKWGRGAHTCLDVVLNDERYVRNVEVREAIRGGMGKLWRTCLGWKPGVRKGGRSEGREESSGPRNEERRGGRRGVKIEDLSRLLTPKIQRPRPGLMTWSRVRRVFNPPIDENEALAIKNAVAMSRPIHRGYLCLSII